MYNIYNTILEINPIKVKELFQDDCIYWARKPSARSSDTFIHAPARQYALIALKHLKIMLKRLFYRNLVFIKKTY